MVKGERVERRLTAILAADVAGYSRLMGEDEEGTLKRLGAIRSNLVDPKIAEYRGPSSRPPEMGYWSSSRASSRRSPARWRCTAASASAMPMSRQTDASSTASVSIWAT